MHGLSYFSYDWIGPASALASDREVVAIDMRGFGQSGWSPSRDYKLETLVGDVLNMLDALGWRQAVLIGHSFGGRVALATAGWNADRAAAVVLVDFAPDIAAAGRRATAERIGRQPDVFASIDEALAYHERTQRRRCAPATKRSSSQSRAVFSSGAISIFVTISEKRSTPASRLQCRLSSGRCWRI